MRTEPSEHCFMAHTFNFIRKRTLFKIDNCVFVEIYMESISRGAFFSVHPMADTFFRLEVAVVTIE